MKTSLLKAILLFISIPLINSISFAVGTLFHQIYQSAITEEQFAEYQRATVLMLVLLAVSIPVFEVLHDLKRISNRTTIRLYLVLFTIIAVLTSDQFSFRPYEHGLTFLSITSILITREFINRKFVSRKAVNR